jgi:hypothetical protein
MLGYGSIIFFTAFAGISICVYGLIRWRVYLKDPSNVIAYHTSMALMLTGFGVAMFALYRYMQDDGPLIVTLATLGEGFGFTHFIATPAYIYFEKRVYILLKYCLYLFTLWLAIIHFYIPPPLWNASFSHVPFSVAICYLYLLDGALLSNFLLVLHNYKTLKNRSWYNTVGSLVLYGLSSLCGLYYFLGNNIILLNLAGAGLTIGGGFVIFTALAQSPRPKKAM